MKILELSNKECEITMINILKALPKRKTICNTMSSRVTESRIESNGITKNEKEMDRNKECVLKAQELNQQRIRQTKVNRNYSN